MNTFQNKLDMLNTIFENSQKQIVVMINQVEDRFDRTMKEEIGKSKLVAEMLFENCKET